MLFELSDMMSNAENPERIILDRHQMKNGLYVRIDREGNIKDNLIVNKETSTIGNTYWWFRDRDYYSSLLEMNKPVDTKKKIHSNNMYTVFIKCQNLPEVGEDKQLNYNQLEEIFDGYYNRLNREYDKKEKEILEIAYIKMKENVTPKFTQELSKNIQEISNGKYKNVRINDEEGIIVEKENGEYVSSEKLSIGTIEKLYLSLRFGAIKEISNETMPIILDEAFAYYDEQRLTNVLKYLNEEFKQNQIIIFTCTNREEDILEKENIQYKLTIM